MVGDGPASGTVSPAMGPVPRASPEAVFRANLDLIAEVIKEIARCHRLSADERDEFASEVHVKLIENDYGIFRRFEHRSKLKTYLIIVVQRHFLDYRNKKWGKWRKSAEAQRLGPLAIRLERLVWRDGYTFDEAVGILQTNEQVALSREELYALLQRLPTRTSRRFVEERAGENVQGQHISSEQALVAGEQAEASRRAEQILGEVLRTLPPQDQLIIKLRYRDGMTLARIAKLIGQDPGGLYRRVPQIRQMLRSALEAQGVSAEDVLGTESEDAHGG